MYTIWCKEKKEKPEYSLTYKTFFTKSLEDSKTLVELLAIDRILKEILIAEDTAKYCFIDIDMVYKDTFYVRITNYMKRTEIICEYTICP